MTWPAIQKAVRRALQAPYDLIDALGNDEDPAVRPHALGDTMVSRAVKNSLSKTGQLLPVITHQGKVVAGHTTVRAAAELGWPSVKAVEVGSDKEYELRLEEILL